MALLTIGELLKDIGAAEPKHKSRWEEGKAGVRGAAGRKQSGPKYMHCQMTLSNCPGCVFCYCLLYQPVAFTPKFFADSTYWFPADFVQSFFMLCHHHTHDQHKFKILYIPIPQNESELSDSNVASPSVRRISSLYDFNEHTTTLIHVILRASHFVVIVVDIPSCVIEVVDGFWDPKSSAARIKRSRLYKAINSLMQNVSIFPHDAEIIWEMALDKKHYTVSYGSNHKWMVKYRCVPPQIDDSSCGPRGCSVAASIFFPNDFRSRPDFTGWSRHDIINLYKELISQHENDPCLGLSIRVKSDVVLDVESSSNNGRHNTHEETKLPPTDFSLILEDSRVQSALEEHLILPVSQQPLGTGQPTITPSTPIALHASSSTRAATAQTTSGNQKEDLQGESTKQPSPVILSTPNTVWPVITLPPNLSIPYKVDAKFYIKYLSRYTTAYKDHMAQSAAGTPPPKAFCPMLNRKPSSCLCMFFNEDRSLSFSYFMAQYLSLFFNSPNDQARCQFFFESICYSSSNKTLMVDLSCTECPASISVWRSDCCANAT
jgi:hypothetical protein